MSDFPELDAYYRTEELTLPLLKELVSVLQWRIRIVEHRIEQERVRQAKGWDAASEMNIPEFVGVGISERDKMIRRLCMLTHATLEPR